MMFDVILETLATIVGVVGSFAMLPQIYRIFKTKKCQGHFHLDLCLHARRRSHLGAVWP